MVGHMSQPEPAEDWLPTATVAAQLKVSERTVNRWANEGILPSPSRPLVPPAPGSSGPRTCGDSLTTASPASCPTSRPDRRRDRHRSLPRRPGRRHRHLPRHAAPHHVDRGTPSAISDTGTIRVAPDDHGWGSRSTASSAVVASTSRPASAGQRRDPRPRRRCRRRARHRRDRPLDPPQGPAPAALTPSLPGGLVGSPLPVCHSARVERGPTGRPGPASLVVT